MNPLKLSGFNIVYFSSVDWSYTKQRPQHIAEKLSAYAKVLFLNPFGLRSPSFRDFHRLQERIQFNSNGLLPERISVQSPTLYLAFPASQWASRINGFLFARLINKWNRDNTNKKTIFWIGVPSPTVWEITKYFSQVQTVYDCMDDWSLVHPANKLIPATEQRIASSSSLVFASSGTLHQKMKQWNKRSFLLPNGVDFNHFATETETEVPQDLAELHGPVVGYVGEIAGWFDVDLVYETALNNSDLTFVLIGNVRTNVEKLARLKNVRLLGRKDYDVVPSYLKRFDVCLIPFVLNALTSAVNPVKLYEYLAAGKPVVTTALTELHQFREVVEVADRQHFSNAIRSALATATDQEMILRRMELARDNTWDIRVQNVMEILQSMKVDQ